jgi:hypothetical protein
LPGKERQDSVENGLKEVGLRRFDADSRLAILVTVVFMIPFLLA